MVVDTRKSNATKHPGKLLESGKQKRRTRTQVEEDKARTKAVAITAENDANLKRLESVSQVADIMDSVDSEERAIQRYKNRPDLRPGQSGHPSNSKHAEDITDVE